MLDLEQIFPLSIKELFLSQKSPSSNTLITKLWEVILPFICWGVWKERNDRVPKGKETNFVQLFYKIKHLVIENISTIGKGHQPQNEQEEKVIKKLNLEGLSVFQNGNNLRNLARWDCPPQEWCKINFYGALKGNLGMTGYRVIIRNMNEEVQV